MNEKLTEIVFILDRSGSMGGLESDTIGGFNSMLNKQKKEEGEAFVSTIFFDDASEVIHDRLPINEVKPITDKEYYVRGCTALLDAVGGAIDHIRNIHKYARREDVPAKTLFIITTDGCENSSHRYSYEEVKRLIEKQKEKDHWEFLFLGANIDAAVTASRIGIDRHHSVDYISDSEGTSLNYEVLSEAVSCVRSSKACAPCAALESGTWKMDIEADYQARKRKRS